MCFTDIETTGIRVDLNALKELKEMFEKRERGIIKKFHEHPDSQKFYEKYGRMPDIAGKKDISELLYGIACLPIRKKTEKTFSPSSDKEALEANIKESKLCRYLLDYSEVQKSLSTYIVGIEKRLCGSRLFPQFNMHTTLTYRSSSTNPNLQNWTTRLKLGRMVRRMIVPEPGHILLESDYSGAEIRVMAMYTKDPILVDYITKGKDMHREQAAALFNKPPEEISKEERYMAKNRFVFPEFYGSYYKSIAPNIGLPEDIVLEVEQRFWEKFHYIKEWQDEYIEKYYEKNYVELFLGFRRHGPLRRTEIINTPIQGTSYHLLQTAVNKINVRRKKEKWNTLILGQIHDSILLSVDENEFGHVKNCVTEIMTTPAFDWVNVPLEVEFSVGNNWEKMESMEQNP
jgi:DNA polymerase-1